MGNDAIYMESEAKYAKMEHRGRYIEVESWLFEMKKQPEVSEKNERGEGKENFLIKKC